MGINDAIIIIDTRLIVQAGLDIDAALMIGGVSLYVITIRLSIL